MQMIYEDKGAGNISVSTENANFPKENLSNYNPASLWKATTSPATITVTISGAGGYAWALYNISDSEIDYRIKNGAATVQSGTISPDLFFNFWLDDQNVSPSTSIEFDFDGSPVSSAGILRGGNPVTSDDPKKISRNFKDFSEIEMTRNQAYAFYQKNRVWMFSGVVQSTLKPGIGNRKSPGVSNYLYFYKTVAPYPMAFKVIENTYDHFTFGLPTFKDSDEIYYGDDNEEFVDVSFSIEEVL